MKSLSWLDTDFFLTIQSLQKFAYITFLASEVGFGTTKI